MKNILIRREQLLAMQNLIKNISNRGNVQSITTMQNSLMPETFIVRYKEFYTYDDGSVATDIHYTCIDKEGKTYNCFDRYGENLYQILRDYDDFSLSAPNVKII